ncbi:arginase family protein [Agreia sp. VKM Ac-1783]|uniref:arginase family protein n=1 Tax=Agreia sp. VKM Ac-1783 TaxID=1938889 RepID=UPI000A2ABAB5|nr:arginase family protein [Agreia sp. VKM Ac-1783]SMQ68093.1 arginase [Agreia sp. VKM Ac-1783]
MPATFVIVPQWQGSGSSRAMRLVDGASAIQGDLPAAATRVVDVPVGAGESQGTGVLRYTAIQSVLANQRRVLASTVGPVVTIGGDCAVELGAIPHALESSGESVAVVWFDAHGDLNSPETSPSHAFHGMVLRSLLGDGPEALVPATVLQSTRVVLAGTRSLDDDEAAYIDAAGLRVVSVEQLQRPEAVVEAIAETGARSVYIHVDLDVIDPAEIDGVGYPEPFGLTVQQLVQAISAIRARFSLVGAGITEFAPSAPESASDDLPSILRIISALTRPVVRSEESTP